MFHECYICFFYIFLDQIWQMSFDCCPVHFNLEVVTKMSDYDVIIDDVTKTCFFFKSHSESYDVTGL